MIICFIFSFQIQLAPLQHGGARLAAHEAEAIGARMEIYW
jgi:hypothetical protein